MWHLVFRRCVTDCLMFYAAVLLHFQPFCWRCQAFVWLWNLESWKLKDLSDILSSFILVTAQIAHSSVVIKVQGVAREHFYFFPKSLTVHQCQWSPASQLRPSSSIGRLQSFGRLPQARTWKSHGVDRVFISVSSQTNTNSLLNSVALLAFHFLFGKLD